MKPKINWKEVKTVLLDMDGTLLDLYFDYYFWQEYLPEIWGKKNNMKTNTAKVKLLDWYQQESGTLSWYCIDFWTRKLNFDVLALKADVRHLIKYRHHAESLLQQLNDLDFSLTMVTNAHEKLIKMKSDETGIDTFFNQILIRFRIYSFFVEEDNSTLCNFFSALSIRFIPVSSSSSRIFRGGNKRRTSAPAVKTSTPYS